MIKVDFDQEKIEELCLKTIIEYLKTTKQEEVFFMNAKQLQKYLNMSWNSIVDHLVSDDKFPKLKLGSKWLFPHKEVDSYMCKYYEEVRDNGGNILKFKRKNNFK